MLLLNGGNQLISLNEMVLHNTYVSATTRQSSLTTSLTYRRFMIGERLANLLIKGPAGLSEVSVITAYSFFAHSFVKRGLLYN